MKMCLSKMDKFIMKCHAFWTEGPRVDGKSCRIFDIVGNDRGCRGLSSIIMRSGEGVREWCRMLLVTAPSREGPASFL